MRLDLEGADFREIEHTPIELFLGFRSDPNVAFVLVSIGLIALLIEFILPGLWAPGILGVICLALGFVALGRWTRRVPSTSAARSGPPLATPATS